MVDDLPHCPLSVGCVQFSGGALAAENKNKVNRGEFIIDHPTLINLSFEWFIDGDDSRNAQATGKVLPSSVRNRRATSVGLTRRSKPILKGHHFIKR